MGAVELTLNGHKHKSYDIVWAILRSALRYSWLQRPVRVLDLTYGRGRWWRRAKKAVQFLVGIDTHDWEKEVEPDVFLLMDARKLDKVKQIVETYEVSLLAVDPPWSRENRGTYTVPPGMEPLYHQPEVKSRELVLVAKELSAELGLPLLYRYKDRIPSCSHFIHVVARMKIKGRPARIHYGLCRG